MNKEEQKKAIDAFANVRIAELKNNWAQNYCARKINQGIVSTASLDQKKKDVVEAKNIGEQLIYTAEKSLRDAGDKVPAELRASIENKITDLKKWNQKKAVFTYSVTNA